MYYNESLKVELVYHFFLVTHQKLLIPGKLLIRSVGFQIQEKCGVLASFSRFVNILRVTSL